MWRPELTALIGCDPAAPDTLDVLDIFADVYSVTVASPSPAASTPLSPVPLSPTESAQQHGSSAGCARALVSEFGGDDEEDADENSSPIALKTVRSEEAKVATHNPPTPVSVATSLSPAEVVMSKSVREGGDRIAQHQMGTALVSSFDDAAQTGADKYAAQTIVRTQDVVIAGV